MSFFAPVPQLNVLPARPPNISVANPQSGDFVAPQVAQSVADVYQSENTLYLTAEDRVQRICDIVASIQEVRRCHDGAMQLMAYGGDGTFKDVVQATMHYLFPDLDSLMTLPIRRIADRMLASGIHLGLVRVGTENDVGWLSGSPIGEIGAVLTYCDEAALVPLNIGVAQYLDRDGQPLKDVAPTIFPHNISAGTVIAKTFQETEDLRGRKSRRRRWWRGLKLGFSREPFLMRWQNSRGQSEIFETPEVFIHATPLAGRLMGFPGLPRYGLAVKIFPDIALTKAAQLTAELARLGRAIRKGDLKPAAPLSVYHHMDAMRQLQIREGQHHTFQFLTANRTRCRKPIQSCGDYEREAYGLKVRALPRFPYHLSMPGSLLHRTS